MLTALLESLISFIGGVVSELYQQTRLSLLQVFCYMTTTTFIIFLIVILISPQQRNFNESLLFLTGISIGIGLLCVCMLSVWQWYVSHKKKKT